MTHARRTLGAAALILTAAATAALPRPAAAQQDDAALVRRAVLDYVEGFYEGDSTKLVRSVRPEVYKYGFSRRRDSTHYVGMQMPWTGFMDYARNVKARSTQAPPTARRDVVVFDVQDQTASAKLTAFWGTDYLLLAKYDGRWMISSVMWQSPPKRP